MVSLLLRDFAWAAVFGGIVGFTVWSLGASVSMAVSFGLAVYLGFIIGRAV